MTFLVLSLFIHISKNTSLFEIKIKLKSAIVQSKGDEVLNNLLSKFSACIIEE
jgi:hypothetical protein